MLAVFLRVALLDQLFQTPRDGPQRQSIFSGPRPGLERHAGRKLPEHACIQSIVLAALHHGLRKMPHCARIRHHHRDPFLRAERQRQVQTIQPRRFQDHSHPPPLAGESPQQRFVSRSGVCKTVHSSFSFHRYYQLFRTHCNPTRNELVPLLLLE